MERIKIGELITWPIDIDVCDDYDERVFVAFCGPLELTEAGEREFADVLERDAIISRDSRDCINFASLPAETVTEAERLRVFFHSAAGYCSDEKWHMWFKD